MISNKARPQKPYYLCRYRNTSEETSWNLLTKLPMDSVQFESVKSVLKTMRADNQSYISIDFVVPLDNATFVQATLMENFLWNIELHFETPCVFTYRSYPRNIVHLHSWTQYSYHTASFSEVCNILEKLLCCKALPQVHKWRNCTKEIFLEQLNRRHEAPSRLSFSAIHSSDFSC